MEERGVRKIRCISARVGIPMIEAVVNEDNEELQHLWARLMVCAISKNLMNAKRSHVETLKTFEPEDARVLKGISVMFIQSLLHDERMYASPQDLAGMLKFWQSLRHLERVGII